MDYNQLYINSYSKVFQERECFIYNVLFEAKKIAQSYNYTSNELLKKFHEYEVENFKYLKKDPYLEIYNLFNKRFNIYDEDRINNIVNLKIIPFLENSKVKMPKTLNMIISEIAKFDALSETSRILSNNYSLYKLIYDLNSFSKFKLISYNSTIENVPLFKKLNNKLYPPAKPSKSKITKHKIENDEYLNVKEVAELTNYAVATIYDLKHKGKLPFYKIGAKLQFKKSEIIEWLEKGKGTTTNDLEDKVAKYIQENS